MARTRSALRACAFLLLSLALTCGVHCQVAPGAVAPGGAGAAADPAPASPAKPAAAGVLPAASAAPATPAGAVPAKAAAEPMPAGPLLGTPLDATSAAAAAAAAEESALPAAAPAPVLPPKAPEWMQRDGVVPLPRALEPDTPKVAAPPALPPANMFNSLTVAPPDDDPTGTNVFSDPKYAPQNVRAALEGDEQTSIIPGAKSGATTDSVFATPRTPTTVPDVPAAPAAGAGDSVYANSGSAFNNRYVPSVGTAIGSSDMVAQMLIDAPEQAVAPAGDVIRGLLANMTKTPVENIYVYKTRTINNAGGQPSLDISFLFKNNLDVERTRQQNVLLSPDQARGFIDAVTRQTTLKVQPGSIKTSSAVNDGGSSSGAAMPGALPGMMPGLFAGAPANGSLGLPGLGVPLPLPAAVAPAVPAAAPAAEPAKSSAATAAPMVLPALMFLAAFAAL